MSIQTQIYTDLVKRKNMLTAYQKEKLKAVLVKEWGEVRSDVVHGVIAEIPEGDIKEFVSPDLAKRMVDGLQPGSFDVNILTSLDKIWDIVLDETRAELARKTMSYLSQIQSEPNFADADEQILHILKLLIIQDVPEDERTNFWNALFNRMTNLQGQPSNLARYVAEAVWFIEGGAQADDLANRVKQLLSPNEQASQLFIDELPENYLLEVIKWQSLREAITELAGTWGEGLKRTLYSKFTPKGLITHWEEYLDEDEFWDIGLIYSILKSLYMDKKITGPQFASTIAKLITDHLGLHIGNKDAHPLLIEILDELQKVDLTKASSALSLLVTEAVVPKLTEKGVQDFANELLGKLSGWADVWSLGEVSSALELVKNKALNILAQNPRPGTKLVESLENVLEEDSLNELVRKLLGLLLSKARGRKSLVPYKGVAKMALRHRDILSEERSKVVELCDILVEAGRRTTEKQFGLELFETLTRPPKKLREKVGQLQAKG